MIKLSPKQVADYFNRSYKAVDGLWFLKIEEKYGFGTALELDNEVWKIMPKIQARLINSFLELENILPTLLDSIITKLDLEGFEFTTEKLKKGFRIMITKCPWYTLMIKSGRENLAKFVGKKICKTEYQVWASEYGKENKFELLCQKCDKSDFCVLEFQYNNNQ
jgi:hypothetical protein